MQQNIQKYFQSAKTYIHERSEIFIGIGVVAALVLFVIVVATIVENSNPKIVYQPTKACDMLTESKAKSFLGDNLLKTNATEPVQSQNLVTSKCGYTNGNPDTNKMVVAAIIVRSGINDEGVKQNKNEFTEGKPASNVETIGTLGESAYYKFDTGQLNILDGKNWIILSYGVGAAPESNDVSKSVELARTIVE